MIAILILIVWAVVWFMIIIGTGVLCAHVRSKYAEPYLVEPVTVLKPVRGTEQYLGTCLGSFFNMNLTNGDELIFCAEHADDPACDTVKRLMAQYPDVQARLVVAPVTEEECANPKIRSVYLPYIAHSKNRLILLSDSNVVADKNYIQDQLSDFNSGLLTSIVRGVRPDGFVAHIEQAYMNGFLARWLVVTHIFGHPCVLGKSMLFYRPVMETRAGGLLAVGQTLAEDYASARAYHKAGLPLGVARHPVAQVIGRYRFSDYWGRHIRWGRMRKYQAPAAFMLEPLSQMVTLGAAASWATGRPSVFAVHCTVWFLLDYLVITSLGDEMTIPLFCGWVTRECLAPLLWLHAMCGSTVEWRGRAYKLGRGGAAKKV